MKVYISGGITGLPDGNRQAFAQAENDLSKKGDDAINPHVLCANIPEGSPWESYMKECLVALYLCDAIYMLKGWKQSKGANIEHEKAIQMGLKVMYEDVK